MNPLWILAAPLLLVALVLALRSWRRAKSDPAGGSPSDGGVGPWMASDFEENTHHHQNHGESADSDAGGGADGGAPGGGD
ncbi:MAG: hypothetical protein J0L84_16260 [Verrucomicrobia bacterium]|nr:hypothetical protein [Verrucomicrobiota bacterium]